MPVEWSTSAPDLLLSLDRETSVSLRAQLEDRLRVAVRSGRLGTGERLPSTRSLAEHLGLSRGVVQECFEQLVAEGYLVSRHGSGTRVAEVAVDPAPRARVRASSSAARPARPLVADF